jgi:hypothetical protein
MKTAAKIFNENMHTTVEILTSLVAHAEELDKKVRLLNERVIALEEELFS